MNVIESQFIKNEVPPKCCSYCDEEKNFLMVKPVAWAVKGEMTVNVNHTSKQLWMCLECLSMELDMMGLSVDIHEYE
jgi:hypothetical protein